MKEFNQLQVKLPPYIVDAGYINTISSGTLKLFFIQKFVKPKTKFPIFIIFDY